MAENEESTEVNRAREEDTLQVGLYRQAVSLAMGEHYLSKYVPPLLLLCDALLCSLIISRITCKFILNCHPACIESHRGCVIRHGDRLESVHGTD